MGVCKSKNKRGQNGDNFHAITEDPGEVTASNGFVPNVVVSNKHKIEDIYKVDDTSIG